nr:hypothetical protein GZ18F2_19 [uncultured archaeon GZfos18F2]
MTSGARLNSLCSHNSPVPKTSDQTTFLSFSATPYGCEPHSCLSNNPLSLQNCALVEHSDMIRHRLALFFTP